jgi:hypothetical protein
MADYTTMEEQVPDQRYAFDNKLYVVFYMKALQNGGRTEKEGRPIFDDVPHVRIHVPGDKSTVIDTMATEEHKQRFPTQWAKFEKGMSQAPEGTPVEEWPMLTTSQAAEFKAINIFTVEQIASMSDLAAGRFMGGNELKRKAETFLKVSKDTAEAQRLVTANAELQDRLDAQSKQITELAAQVAILSQKAGEAPSANSQGKARERPGAGSASMS